jgi:hypothetical protein
MEFYQFNPYSMLMIPLCSYFELSWRFMIVVNYRQQVLTPKESSGPKQDKLQPEGANY